MVAANPRARGENILHVRIGRRIVGQPPRSRGKRLREEGPRHWERPTPAHAGKTAWVARLEGRSGGQPPRTRGKPL